MVNISFYRKTREQKRKGAGGPFLVTFKVSEHILSKVEPIIKDICKRQSENN